jgi:solute carrier family 35 protein F1/2
VSPSTVVLFAAYALCIYALYSFMPLMVKMTSATAVNLFLLIAGLFCGIFLFHFAVRYIYYFLVVCF